MKIEDFCLKENEKPLDHIPVDGGFTNIFRTIGCIGDSLASGEFESTDESGANIDYHDFYEYSWGQYLARATGSKVYNFSRGGMTAKKFMEHFADENDVWNPEKICQAYIIALGVNDAVGNRDGIPVGNVGDINPEDYMQNADTFCGWYARIIQKIKQIQPQARIFLMTIPRDDSTRRNELREYHAKLIYKLAELFDHTYVIDFLQYAPVFGSEVKKNFYLGSHMNPAGYSLVAKLVMSYIDYIIRSDFESFAQVAFIGRDMHNYNAKW